MHPTLRTAAVGLNVLILVIGAYFVAQGFYLPAALALAVAAPNLLTLNHPRMQGASKFFTLVPATITVMVGAFSMGAAFGFMREMGAAALLQFGLPALVYFLAGMATMLYVLTAPTLGSPPR